MQLYEFEGKKLFTEQGIPVPKGDIAKTPQEAAEIAKTLGSVVLKPQVRRGGRGKAGAIRRANTPEDAFREAASLFNSSLDGEKIQTILVEEMLSIEKELYVAITNDRSLASPVVLCCSIGGVDIEEVAKTQPNLLAKRPIDIRRGLYAYQAYGIAGAAGIRGPVLRQVGTVMTKLWNIYREYDAELVEINPLCVTSNGNVVAADAKVILDDNAEFRRKRTFIPNITNERERLARQLQMAYIELNPDGEIGVIFGGAGLGMTILDLINEAVGPDKLTCFLDIGGRSDKYPDRALEICLTFPKLKGILVHAIGGMGQVEEFAAIFCRAVREQKPKVPIFLNLAGTGETAAIEFLRKEIPELRKMGILIEWSSFTTIDDNSVYSRHGGVDNIELPIKRLLEMAGLEYRRNPPDYLPPHPNWEQDTRTMLKQNMARRPEPKYNLLSKI